MPRNVYRFEFDPDIDPTDIRSSLLLARWGTEALFGVSVIFLEASAYYSAENRFCVIDISSEPGECLARLFTGYLLREFDEHQFRVTREEIRRPACPTPSSN
jgi:hypothetical protein